VEILEGLSAHSRTLSHGGGRPAEGDPPHVVVSIFVMDRLNVILEYVSEFVTGYSGILLRIQRCTNTNERISLFQYVELGARHEANVLSVVGNGQLANYPIVFERHQRCGA